MILPSKTAAFLALVSVFVTPNLAFVTVPSRHHCTASPTSLKYRDRPDDGTPDMEPPAIRPEVLRRGGVPKILPPPLSPFLEMGEHVGDKSRRQMSNLQSVGDIMEHQHQPKMPRTIWDSSTVRTVQGGALRTWSLEIPYIDHVQVLLKNEGTPMHATVDLWHGPDNAPVKMAIYSDDGSAHPFSCILATPGDNSHSIGIKNKGPMEYPCGAVVIADMDEVDAFHYEESGLSSLIYNLQEYGDLRKIQGDSSSESYVFPPSTESVQVLIQTDGRPCHARLELTQGPNDIKQVVEMYMEDGEERPFFAVLETPGVTNTIRIVNVGAMSFPIIAAVEPYVVDDASHTAVVRRPAAAPTSVARVFDDFAERVDGPPGFYFVNQQHELLIRVGVVYIIRSTIVSLGEDHSPKTITTTSCETTSVSQDVNVAESVTRRQECCCDDE